MQATPDIDLGRLLRLDEMVTQAAQTEAVRDSAAALVHAYTGLRNEILDLLKAQSLRDLRAEFERLFTPLGEPQPWHSLRGAQGHVELAAAAEEALLRLRQVGGWVKGLIREMTLAEQMRLDAEARARLQAKPPPGFAP